MDTIILAAGRGSRLSPLTDDRPKALIEFSGKPLIQWQLDALQRAGLAKPYVVTGYRADMFASCEAHLVWNSAWDVSNMVASLMCLEAHLETSDEVLITYGDIIYDDAVLEAIRNASGDICVVVDKNWRALWETRYEDPLFDVESLRLGDENVILDIGQKVSSLEMIEAQYIGMIRLRSAGIKALLELYRNPPFPWYRERSQEQAYMTDLIMGLIEQGHKVTAVPIYGGWLEFDTLSDLSTYNNLKESGCLTRFFSAA